VSRHYTPEEVEQRYVGAKGEDLGRVFYQLFNECAHVHLKWRTFVTLFGTSEERVNLLNDAAGSFFGMLQAVLWEDVLLNIARLTDKPSVAGHSVLTLRRLPDLAKDVSGLEGAMDTMDKKVRFVRDWRNRHLAHRNLDLALDRAEPLEGASRQKVYEALGAIAASLNTVEGHYCDDAPSAYDFGIDGRGDPDDLLRLLKIGIAAGKVEFRQ